MRRVGSGPNEGVRLWTMDMGKARADIPTDQLGEATSPFVHTGDGEVADWARTLGDQEYEQQQNSRQRQRWDRGLAPGER